MQRHPRTMTTRAGTMPACRQEVGRAVRTDCERPRRREGEPGAAMPGGGRGGAFLARWAWRGRPARARLDQSANGQKPSHRDLRPFLAVPAKARLRSLPHQFSNLLNDGSVIDLAEAKLVRQPA